MERRAEELAALVGGELEGPADRGVIGPAPLEEAGPDQVSYLDAGQPWERAERSRAGVLLAPASARTGAGPSARAIIWVDEPRLAFARVLELFQEPPWLAPGVHPSACVAPDAELGEGVRVGPQAFVGSGARLGDGTLVYPGARVGRGAVVGQACCLRENSVVSDGVRLGDRVILQPGAVVGSDGFGYARAPGGRHRKIPHLGTVVVGDDVEIGANSTIDRATLGETVIGRGTKIDNLVHVAHNVQVGEDCLLVAQVGVAGSARLGRGVVLAGQAGVADHVQLGDGTVVAAQAGVLKDVEGGLVSGLPARPHAETMRALAAQRRVPELVREVAALRAEVGMLRDELTYLRAEREGP
ncbi:UDP-3-O-(3-hydroxymyristoyl)glucosamine N-acyltransferase [Limnochorda pilosa]|uniref:UDP-3-O-acylglucosamine N-acyltransferase n=1 Tax=Limnochorda pilosa TaxID=1555112 RepID=A0A0K2SP35_LIMPI|nr:UDP-3-O-(3-hydroxymyristoyl)glucosamine N-acyltransferase [Limnochorda pilosa]BAS28898.1 UDP-3-O-(3-hydroxymyristoyl) glucosamine N-acyltransferase [Limnochorda pilosa]